MEIKERISISKIKELLLSEKRLILNYENITYTQEDIYQLISDLPNLNVSEIRPIKTIVIERGIDSKELLSLKVPILGYIDSYNSERRELFNAFMIEYGIKRSNVEFATLRTKLQSEGVWPRGIFGNWKYWAHGTDLEFENNENGKHFNIFVGNYEHLNSRSLLKYIVAISQEKKIKILTEGALNKFLDLMIIESELIDSQFEFRHKIITRAKKAER